MIEPGGNGIGCSRPKRGAIMVRMYQHGPGAHTLRERERAQIPFKWNVKSQHRSTSVRRVSVMAFSGPREKLRRTFFSTSGFPPRYVRSELINSEVSTVVLATRA